MTSNRSLRQSSKSVRNSMASTSWHIASKNGSASVILGKDSERKNVLDPMVRCAVLVDDEDVDPGVASGRNALASRRWNCHSMLSHGVDNCSDGSSRSTIGVSSVSSGLMQSS